MIGRYGLSLGVIAAVAFIATSPAPLSAQCGNCDLGGDQSHFFGSSGGPTTCAGWAESGCHTSSRAGHCYSVHYQCEAEQEDLQDVFAGLESGDPAAVEEALLTLARRGESDRVLVNHARNAIQLLDCALETVLVHVPFPREVLTTIE